MIFLIKDNNSGILVISEKYNEDLGELLYTKDKTSLQNVCRDLLPYRILDNTVQNMYYPDSGVINYFKNNCYNNISRTIVKKEQVEKEINNFNSFLEQVKKKQKLCNEDLKNSILYFCDIHNYLKQLYGEEVVSEVLEIIDLCGGDIKNLKNLDLNYKKQADKIFQIREDKEIETNLTPECSNTEELEETSEEQELQDQLKERIQNFFTLGSVFSGKTIKRELKNIYKSLGIKDTAKIINLNEFIKLNKVNHFKRGSCYKVVMRK